MKRSRFTESPIIAVLKEAEDRQAPKDLCREYTISEQAFYRWKSNCCGMEVSKASRPREQEEVNRKLKQIVAENELDLLASKAVVEKEW